MQLSDTDITTIHLVRHEILSRISSRIPIKELCRLSKMGESKLTRGFKYLFGHAIIHYHLIVSMEYAKALLEEGRQVKEVAMQLGYKSQGNFSRAFLKVYNLPPSNFSRAEIEQ